MERKWNGNGTETERKWNGNGTEQSRTEQNENENGTETVLLRKNHCIFLELFYLIQNYFNLLQLLNACISLVS